MGVFGKDIKETRRKGTGKQGERYVVTGSETRVCQMRASDRMN